MRFFSWFLHMTVCHTIWPNFKIHTFKIYIYFFIPQRSMIFTIMQFKIFFVFRLIQINSKKYMMWKSSLLQKFMAWNSWTAITYSLINLGCHIPSQKWIFERNFNDNEYILSLNSREIFYNLYNLITPR